MPRILFVCTGSDLQVAPYITYLEDKFTGLYNLTN